MSDGKWHKVADVKRFLEDKGNVRRGAHSFSKRILNWQYCAHCGLVALKNDATRKAMRAECVYYED